MPTPARLPSLPVPCITSSPTSLLCPAGCGMPVYDFADLVSDCLRLLSRLDKQDSSPVPVPCFSVVAAAPCATKSHWRGSLDLSNKHFGTSKEF